MTKIDDVSKSNEDVQQEIFNSYYDKIYKKPVDWFSSFLRVIVERLVYVEVQNSILNGQVWCLLQNIGGELVLDYDTYVELFKQAKEFGPRKTHSYVQEDGKFHIWIEKIDVEEDSLNKLFGGTVEVVDDSSEDIQT